MCTLKDVSTVRLLGLKLNAFRFFFQILFQSALLQVQSYIHFFSKKYIFFKKKERKTTSIYLSSYIMIIINLLTLPSMKLDWSLEELRVVTAHLKAKFSEPTKSEEVKRLFPAP